LILDAHTHFFSRAFFDGLVEQAAEARATPSEELWPLVEGAIELPDPDPVRHAERWVAELDRHGVRAAVTFASLPGEAAAVAAGCRAAAGRLVPYLAVDPTTEAGLAAGRRGLEELGYRGILLFPALHHFDPADQRLDPLYASAGLAKAPVVVHCGLLEIKLRDRLGIRPRYDLRFANPLAVAAAAERHRSVHFVIPHFGAGFFRETLLAGAESPNVLVDSSSSNSWLRADPVVTDRDAVFRQALGVFGPSRIMFGTDSSTFPRGWRHDLLEAQVGILDRLDVRGEARTAILGGNLAALLGIDPSA